MEGKLNENYLRLIPGLCLEDRKKIDRQVQMAASDLVSVRGQVMKYPYIPTGIKGEINL